jgi:3-oxosteroid 1-dehydrogenase
MFRSFKSFSAAMRMMGRTLAWRVRGREPLSMGGTLVAQLMAIVHRLEIPVLLDTPLKSLIQDGDRVVGVVTGEGPTEQRIMASHGVLLATGGFAKNSSYRKQFQEVDGRWSPASPDDTGDGQRLAPNLR